MKNKIVAVAAVEYSDSYYKIERESKSLSFIKAMVYFSFLVEPNSTRVVLDMDEYMRRTNVKAKTAIKNLNKLKRIGFLIEASEAGSYWVNPEMAYMTYVDAPKLTPKQIEMFGECKDDYVEVDEDDMYWTRTEVLNKHLLDMKLDLINTTN